jgi:plasmid stability protein
MTIGLDLTLVPIDAESGRARFGPALAYALAVSELVDLSLAERITLRGDRLVVQQREAAVGSPLLDKALVRLREDQSEPPTVSQWVAERGPWRIDAYIHALEAAGTLLLVSIDPPTRGVKRIEVRDPQRARSAVDRFTSAIAVGDSSPYEEQAFAALVKAARCAGHLQGWQHRSDRKRLRNLCRAACQDRDDDASARTILRQGLHALRVHAKHAGAGGSSRTIDEQIGLTQSGWWGAGSA